MSASFGMADFGFNIIVGPLTTEFNASLVVMLPAGWTIDTDHSMSLWANLFTDWKLHGSQKGIGHFFSCDFN